METDPTLADAVAKLAATKAEHRKLLQVVAADAGMDPDTRRTLIEHLLQEEDEHVRRIAALAGGRDPGAEAPAPEPPATSSGLRLTVGSLKREAPPGSRLGSLRQGR